MSAVGIVEPFDVIKDSRLSFGPCAKGVAVNQFGLEGGEETLHRRVVVAVACATHAGCPSTGGQVLLVKRTGVLAATI